MAKKTKKATRKDKSTENDLQSPFDPNGSYTGKPLDPKEKPVQDADDL